MIKDAEDRESIVAQWKTVRRYEAMMKTNTLGAFADGALLTPDFLNGCNTLVCIFAFAVLERVLRILLREGACPEPPEGRTGFKALMNSSQTALPWVDFALVAEGRDERHKAAHGLKIIPRADCWRYINAIERELVAWGVLAGPIEADYVITVDKLQ